MTGEAVGILAEYIYKKQPGELTEQEKENISAWATLASDLVGGLVGGDTQSVANSAQAGKIVVENNHLRPESTKAISEGFANCHSNECIAGVRKNIRKNLIKFKTAHGNEVVYRTMPPKQYERFLNTGVMPATTEILVSPVLSYSSKYEGITVKIAVKPGTFAEL